MVRETNIGIYFAKKAFSEAQQRRLNRYQRDTAKDSDKVLFDDAVERVLKKYAWNPKRVDRVVGYLQRIGFNQSVKRYSMAEEQVKEHFTQDEKKPFLWNQNFQKATSHLVEMLANFNCRQLDILSDEQFEGLLRRAKAHAGYQYLISGKKSKGENVEGICQEFEKQLKQARKKGTFDIPLLVGFRTQNSDILDDDGNWKSEGERTKVKTRVIMMSSIIFLFLEEHWAGPMDEVFHSLEWFTPGKSEKEIDAIIKKAHRRGMMYWFSADFSRYDATIPSWMISHLYLKVYKSLFRNDDHFDDQMYSIMVHDLIHKDVVLANEVVHLDHGNGSGFRNTTATSCGSTYLAYLSYFYSIGWEEGKDFIILVCGDDSLVMSYKPVDKAAIATYFQHNFGFICHAHKCSDGDISKHQYPKYLSREWRPNGQWRHPDECLAKLLYPERFRNHGIVSPEVVVWAYILTFPLGMRELINVEKFRRENSFVYRQIQHLVQTGRQTVLPGSIGYFYEYADEHDFSGHIAA